MDLKEILKQLYAERKRVDRIIQRLEALEESSGSRRGRKSMSAEERRQVSERMRRYWAERRKPPL